MRFAELVSRARAAAVDAALDPTRHGFVRLTGGMSHVVLAPLDDDALVVKVYREARDGGPQREWDALVALAPTGIAPQPMHVDFGDPPVVVMDRAPGSSRSAAELRVADAYPIGAAHRLVHQTVPTRNGPTPHWGLRATRAALLGGDPSEGPSVPAIVGAAWSAAQGWIATVDIDRLLTSAGPCFSRGDPNLSNYLWSEEGLSLVDWENSGPSDPVLELADMAEHASSRALDDDFWGALADATQLEAGERDRIPPCRRLLACFWLVLIESRQRQAQPTTVTLEEQAGRTLAVLEA